MSVHRSLVTKDTLKRQRSVLTRAERIQKLKEDEKWEDNMSAFGLPKVKVVKVAKKKGKPKEAEDKPEAEAGTEAEAEAAETEAEGKTES